MLREWRGTACAPSPPMSTEVFSSTHLSSNRVWGQLGTTTATEVLDGCRRQRVTGEVIFHAGDRTGTVELRAGSVERAALGATTGDAALAALAGLEEGTFEVVQRLPDLEGVLGSAAEFQGELADVPLIQIMRHVEAHALSVTVTVIAGWDRGMISYRDGDIAAVEVNGSNDPDRIGDLLRLTSGRFRVLAGALELPVPARRAPRRAPTEPFHVGLVAGMRRGAAIEQLPPEADDDAPAAPAPAARAPAPLPVATSARPAGQPASAPAPGWLESRVRALFATVRRGVDALEARLTQR